MPSDPLLLLDTPIVAGSFAISKVGPHVEVEKRLWKSAVRRLALVVSPRCMIRVPTPVCYELMAMNKEWHDFVFRSSNPTFRFAHSSIPNNVLTLAAEYSYSTNCIYYDGEKQKMKSMDPLIAAYCIKGGHYLLTTNQHDFPESHFSVEKTEILTLTGKNGKYRSIVYLLKSRTEETISTIV